MKKALKPEDTPNCEECGADMVVGAWIGDDPVWVCPTCHAT